MAYIAGEGAIVETSADGTAYTEIGQVISISPFSWSNESVDTPDLTRTYKTHRAGLQPDFGTCSFSMKYDPSDASHIAVEALLTSPAMSWLRFTDTDATANTRTGTGSFTKFDVSGIDEQGDMLADCEFKISGEFTKA
jgi:hypothetical protein